MIYRQFTTLLLAAAFLVAGTNAGQGTEALRKNMAKVAQSVGKVLKSKDQNQLNLGQFQPAGGIPSSAGPLIVKSLKDAFQELGVTISDKAPTTLLGRYSVGERLVVDPEDVAKTRKSMVIRVRVSIVDKFGDEIGGFSTRADASVPIKDGKLKAEIDDERTLLTLTGTPVDLPPGEDLGQRQQRIKEIAVDKRGSLARIKNGAILRADPKSPYAIEILVSKQGDKFAPRKITLDGTLKLPRISIAKNEKYHVRLINNSPYEAAVELSIDGLNSFTFSTAKDGKTGKPLKLSMWIVPKNGSITVKGWHHTMKDVHSFLVTEYAKSAAAELNHTSNIGTITAIFAAAWDVDGDPPDDEELEKNGEAATAKGPKVKMPTVAVQRKVGKPRASIALRYAK